MSKLIPDQTEHIEFPLAEVWNRKSLAERFTNEATKVLLTETEVQLVIEALEEDTIRLQNSIDSMADDDELKEGEKWDLELVRSALASLKSQSKGGEPVEPDERPFLTKKKRKP